MGKYDAIRLAEARRERQTSASVLMVEPAAFGFNPETAASNAFASPPPWNGAAELAAREFRALAERLEQAGVAVHRLRDTPLPAKPDALFPNNWISFHADGTLVTYPMEAASRRSERRPDAVADLLRATGFDVRCEVDLTANEAQGRYLEGTGSLVLDRPRRRAYACVSSRTDAGAVSEFDAKLGYATLLFEARGPQRRPIYHTNVMMSLGTRFALVCLDCVGEDDRRQLAEDLEIGGRTIVEVDYGQLVSFACNVIELEDGEGRRIVAMSSGAHASLRGDQKRALEELGGELVHVPIPTIERIAGGGVRCMIADIHLPLAA
ncbi:MAG TPA: arginine deiminase-related protein [Allosphingosinicella sp.]|nr:arginine deiminase-related protein [Allosphingosinicella sp.]